VEEHQPLAELHDLALEWRTHRRLDLEGEIGLPLELLKAWAKLVEGKPEMLAVGFGEPEERESLGMHNPDALVFVGDFRPVENIEQPLDRLDARAVGAGETLLVLEEQQRGACDGVERLDATVDEDRRG
jgi:hypothetical protein